jgi:hypothetical protein
MGMWDTILNGVSRVTGSAATVTATLSPAAVMPGDEMTIEVEVVNGNAPLDVRALVLDVEANEHIALQSMEHTLDAMVQSMERSQGRRIGTAPLAAQPHDANVFRAEVRVAGPITLGVGERKRYTGRVRLPPRSQPTYLGVNVQHTWRLRARLDILGTDPTTAWEAFVVGRRV